MRRAATNETAWVLVAPSGELYRCRANDDQVALVFSESATARRLASDLGLLPVHRVVQTPLAELLFHHLADLDEDGFKIGANWGELLDGLATEPEQLRRELMAELPEDRRIVYERLG